MRNSYKCYALGALVLGSVLCATPLVAAPKGVADFRGDQFLAITNFSGFAASTASDGHGCVLTSPELKAAFSFDEMVVSWNVALPAGGRLEVEARAMHGDRPAKWYHLGRWAKDQGLPRESVLRQRDERGDVDTDTLKLKVPAERFQLRLTLWPRSPLPVLKGLGVCLTDSRWRGTELPPNRLAWGKTLDVPERSQMAYPNGGVLCSPTTVSMILAYWSRQLGEAQWDKDVPEIAAAVFDTNWQGTGNWVFNTAYAGSLSGMTAYVTRLSDVAELEDLVAHGVPAGLSLCYNRLRGKSRKPSGHLVVCVGFTAEGDPVINDPGTSKNVRKVFPRANLVDAWSYSRNAAYLIAPDGKLPPSRFGHW